jgi:L-ascorbate metabolism protein UlaG (beta-lactamase superfamily)
MIKRFFLIGLSSIFILAVVLYCAMPQLGKAPSDQKLEAIKNSPNFREGKFQNINITPDLVEGTSRLGMLYEFLFKEVPRIRPIDNIPSVKLDLLNLPIEKEVLVWFGHSSYFIQTGKKRFLVDPVFSGYASPIPGTIKAFKGTDRYSAQDFPDIDYLIISHDHYDHVDYETILKIKSKIKKVICGLGVGSHFEYWGYSPESIIEKNWNETIEIDKDFFIYTAPARHFSGRLFSRNNTLWMSYLLQSPTIKIYIGGDSGYDTHFADLGSKFGPIDLAIIDNGQYDLKWRNIHTLPNEVIQAAKDLKAKRLFPVHSSKFVLANHSWDEPLSRVSELNKESKITLVTPIIGEYVFLDDANQKFTNWWESVK